MATLANSRTMVWKRGGCASLGAGYHAAKIKAYRILLWLRAALSSCLVVLVAPTLRHTMLCSPWG